MVIVIGEILVDNIGVQKGTSLEMKSSIGGAPFNVASNLSNLGINTTFYGVVGDDIMGRFIIDNLTKNDHLTADIDIDKERNTTLAFFIKDAEGEGKFSFVRNNGADYHLVYSKLSKYIHVPAKMVHFGSLFLQDEEARNNATKLIDEFKRQGKLVSFDVNYREDIFKDGEDFKSYYQHFIKQADIVKFSEDEICLLSNKDNLESALKCFDNKIILVTMGKRGSLCYYKGKQYFSPTKPIHLVDAVGCGDAFFSGVLSYLYEKDINSLTDQDIELMLQRGNACGALNGLHDGATNAFKSLQEVNDYIEKTK